MALLAAMLTAFYMTRLMIMTFHGANRSGEKEQHHIHEVPAVMYVPLIVLAVLSTFGGWINVPEAIHKLPVLGWLPSSEWLHEWLHPVMAPADAVLSANVGNFAEHAPFGGSEAMWAVLSFAIAVAVIVITTRVLGRRVVKPAVESPADTGFKRVLYNKWYVDEIYDAGVVQPLIKVSRWSWKYIDAGLIDGTVNGAGWVSQRLGWLGSRLQTGQLNTYAFAIVLGVLIVLGFVVL
jgi:NADH-quinone oxidoreductase subunit L